MINKIWRYFIARLLIQNGRSPDGIWFEEGDYLYEFITKGGKKKNNQPAQLKEVRNGT